MTLGSNYTPSSLPSFVFTSNKFSIHGKTVSSYYALRGIDLEIKAGDRAKGAVTQIQYGLVPGGHLIFKYSSGHNESGSILFRNTNNQNVMHLHKSNITMGQTNLPITLTVNGTVNVKGRIKITSGGADFVFSKDYKLPTLREVENFITTTKHLPGITPAAKMQAEGLDLSQTTTKLLQ